MNGLDTFFALPTAVKIFIACLAAAQLTLAISGLVTSARTPNSLLPPIGRTPSSDPGVPEPRSSGNGEAEARIADAETSQDMASRGNPSRRTRLLWAVIIILGELVGPIIFFIMRSRHARLVAELADNATAVEGLSTASGHDGSSTAKVEASVSALYDDGPAPYDDGSAATRSARRYVDRAT